MALSDAIDWSKELVFTGKGAGFKVNVLGRIPVKEGVADPRRFEEAVTNVVATPSQTFVQRRFEKGRKAPSDWGLVTFLPSNADWLYVVNKPDETGWNGVKKYYNENGHERFSEAPQIIERYGGAVSGITGANVTQVWIDDEEVLPDFDAMIAEQVELDAEAHRQSNIPGWGGF